VAQVVQCLPSKCEASVLWEKKRKEVGPSGKSLECALKEDFGMLAHPVLFCSLDRDAHGFVPLCALALMCCLAANKSQTGTCKTVARHGGTCLSPSHSGG
jgi:hypothetical protein